MDCFVGRSIQPFMFIGTAGWTIPREHSAAIEGEGSHLERYAHTINGAEINTSFYRSHRESTWKRWAESVPEDFQFSVKAPKAFTHVNGLRVSREELRAFLTEVGALGAKLGPLLFQLPPKLELEPQMAEALLEKLRAEHSGGVVFEPRHPSWFAKKASALLKKYDVARAAADPAVVPEAATAGGASQLVYYRLHGSPRRYYSSYDETYLRQIAHSLRSSKAREVWCIFDNTASGAALGNALALKSLIGSQKIEDRITGS
jgi:uncharacterized protein YecE (DUF72 family)